MENEKKIVKKATRVDTPMPTAPPLSKPVIRPSVKPEPLTYEEYVSHVPEKLELLKGYLMGETSENERFKLFLALFKNLGIYRVVQLLDEDTLNDIDRMHTVEIKRLSDRANLEYTIAKNREMGIKKVAQNLIKLGFNNDAVQEATDLDLDTIQKLREQSE